MTTILVICGLTTFVVSGIIGMILDVKYKKRDPALFWLIGSVLGMIAGVLLAISVLVLR